MNASGKEIKWDKPGTRKPTEAIVAKGQKATGLAKSNVPDRFSMKDAGKKSGVSASDQKAYNVLNRIAKEVTIGAISAGAGAVAGSVVKSAVTKVGMRYAGAGADAAYDVAAKGISTMSTGGKIRNVTTPMGKTIASSKIMSKGQVSAAKSGLEQRAINIALGSAGGTMSQATKDAAKVSGVVKKAVTATGIGGTAAVNKIKKKRK